MEQAAERNRIVNEILRIGHGDLSIFKHIGLETAQNDPELLAHLIAWNWKHGEVRDTKVAFPVLALRGEPDAELYENAAAHLCLLDPKNLLKACRFHSQLPPSNGGGAWLKHAVKRYLKEREKHRNWWDATALQHRKSLKSLYAFFHVKPSKRAQLILHRRKKKGAPRLPYPKGSVFEEVANLKNMQPKEAAGTIINKNVPFLVAIGALGGIKDKPDIALALMERMTGNELVTNTGMLEKIGVFENPMLRAAYDKAVERTKKDKHMSTLKAGRAAKAVAKKSRKAAKKLEQVQEQRLDRLGGIDGDWLVLGDRSSSMEASIDVARHVASLLARQVSGTVHLVFFNEAPRYFKDVTDKTLEQILQETRRVRAEGLTSIGCGLDYILRKGFSVGGIAICSDGGENTHPAFADAYRAYERKFGNSPTVYLYHVPGDPDALSLNCRSSGIQMHRFSLGSRVDYYSLPNLVATMRTNMYSLADEIMETPLLTLDRVFGQKPELKKHAV